MPSVIRKATPVSTRRPTTSLGSFAGELNWTSLMGMSRHPTSFCCWQPVPSKSTKEDITIGWEIGNFPKTFLFAQAWVERSRHISENGDLVSQMSPSVFELWVPTYRRMPQPSQLLSLPELSNHSWLHCWRSYWISLLHFQVQAVSFLES